MQTQEPYVDDEKSRGYLRTLIFVAMAILGPLLAYAINKSAEEKARYQAEQYQNERAQVTLTRIRAFLLNATQLSETLRVLVEQHYEADLAPIETYLDRIVESAPEDLIYGAGVWYEPARFDGKTQFVGPYVHRGPRPGTRVLTKEWEHPSYDFHAQDWYQNAIENPGRPSFTDPYYDNGQVYLTLALSFNDRRSGRVRGVVTVDMILPQLQSLISSVNENSTDVITVIGKSGHLLAHPDAERLMDDAKAELGSDRVKSLLDVPPEYYEPSTWNTIISESKMKENSWKVVVVSPRTSVMSGYLSQRTLIIALTIFYLAALLIIYLLMSFFDEGMSRLKERSIQAVMVEKNQIAAIIDNVQFGLFRADRRGRIQSGYAHSCTTLLSIDPTSNLTRRVFWHFFDLSSREEDNFEAFFEQIFEVPFLAHEMAEQVPSQFQVRGKNLSIRYYPIMKNGEVESVLVSFADISRSCLTAKENDNNKALLRVLRNRDRFAALVAEIMNSDNTLLSPGAWPNVPSTQALRKIRRIIHTWKGDLATFGLVEVSGYMHTIEDTLRPNLTFSQSHDYMIVIKSMLESYLVQNQNILQINNQNLSERQVTVPETELIRIQKELEDTKDLEEAKTKIKAFAERSTMEKAETTLSYLAIAIQDLAKKQDKLINIETRGGDIRLPQRFQTVLTSLIHIVRNSVDHGIEKPKDRGGKDQTGLISLSITEHSESYAIRISDDGRGIDRQKLKNNVLAKGLATESAWDLLSSDEQLLFIFEESISTQSSVNLISGRGIGLDRVFSAVTEQGGTIKVSTAPGFGSTFDITLPRHPSSTKVVAA